MLVLDEGELVGAVVWIFNDIDDCSPKCLHMYGIVRIANEVKE